VAAPVNPASNQFIDAAFWKSEVYDRWVDLAAAWTSYTPVWTGSTSNPSVGNGTLTGAYKRWDGTAKTVQFRILMAAGTSTTFGSGLWSFSLPSGTTLVTTGAAIHGHILDASASNNRYMVAGILNNTSGGQVERIAINGGAGVSGVVPVTWATGDTLILGGTYEIT
jgi:hypothetical protein